MQVLTFCATLDSAGRLELRPGFVTEGLPTGAAADVEALEVELFDESHGVLTSSRVTLVEPCRHPVREQDWPAAQTRLAIGLIGYSEKARSIRVHHKGRVLFERESLGELQVKADWPGAGSIRNEKAVVAWSCSDEGAEAVVGYSYDGGKTWMPMTPPFTPGAISIDASALPGGKDCRFKLVASDGLRTVTLESKPIALPQRGWVGFILGPRQGTTVTEDQIVELRGQGFEMEQRTSEFEALDWKSSLDGPLGSGSRLPVRLSRGHHLVTLAVRGREVASVKIDVTRIREF